MINALNSLVTGPAGNHTRVRCICYILNLCVKVRTLCQFVCAILTSIQAILQLFSSPKRKGKSSQDSNNESNDSGSMDDKDSSDEDTDSDNDSVATDDEEDAAADDDTTADNGDGDGFDEDEEDEYELDPAREASDASTIAKIAKRCSLKLSEAELKASRTTLSKVRLVIFTGTPN